ncbi:MAG: serine/threonine protein kinase, partial [Azonexus sp.]
MRKLMARFADAISLDQKEIQQTVQRAVEEVGEFARVIHLNLGQTTFGKQMRQFAQGGDGSEALVEPDATDTMNGTQLHETSLFSSSPGASEDGEDEPVDAQSVLTAGIQDISNTLVDGFKLNDILRIILETMYRAMGFKRVVLCIRDAKAGVMQGRFGFGPNANEVAKAFRFPLTLSP